MQKQSDCDDELVRRTREGDEEALARIIDRYSPYVGAVVWNIVGGKLCESDAKEIISDSFFLLWQYADRVRPGCLKGYLASIARTRSLNALRKAGREETLEADAITLSAPSAEDAVIRRDAHAALHRCLEALGEPDRSIFLRHYYYGQSAVEIADICRMNLNTVRTKLRRGRDKLRQELLKGGYSIETEDF